MGKKNVRDAVARALAKVHLSKGYFQVLTRTGKTIIINPSRQACEPFGFFFLNRVVTNDGLATVFGVGLSSNPRWNSSFLYVLLDKDQGASFWDNGNDYSSLVNDCGFSLEYPQSQIPDNVARNLVNAMHLDSFNFKNMIWFELKVVMNENDNKMFRIEQRNESEAFFKKNLASVYSPPTSNSKPSNTFTSKPSISNTSTSTPNTTETNEQCPTCNKLFPVSKLEDHFTSCVPPEKRIQIDRKMVQNLDILSDDFNTNARRRERIPSLKALSSEALLHALANIEFSKDELLNLFAHAYEINNHNIIRRVVSLIGPQVPSLFTGDHLIKIIGNKAAEALIIAWLSPIEDLGLSLATTLLEFSIKHKLEVIQKILKNLTNTANVFDTFERSDDEGVHKLCMEKFATMNLNELVSSPKFAMLPKPVQNDILRVSTNAALQKKKEEPDDFDPFDDTPYSDFEGDEDEDEVDYDEYESEE